MIRRLSIVAVTLLLLVPLSVRAQQPAQLRSTPVLTQALADSSLAGVVLSSSVLELVPGAELTQPHRHDAELFGYVLEGVVLTGLEHGPIQRYEAGQMFHEPLGILHTHFANESPTEPARVL